jgi:RND family efflux transporter MFP subunit
MRALRRHRLTAVLLLLTVLGSVAGGCAGEAAPAEEVPRPYARATRVQTLVVERQSFDENIQVTGAVEAIHDATLAADIGGTVEYIAERGARVSAGAVVARQDQATAQAAVRQAEAQLQTAVAERALAIDNRDRLRPLQDRQIISAREFEQARLQLEQAEARVKQAEAALTSARVQLENTVIRAPFAGTIEETLVERGEHAGTGDPVVRLVSTDRVQVVAGIPERYSTDLREGMSVAISFPGVDLPERVGEVTFVGAAIEMMSRTFPIEVATPNPDGDLKPMMLAELRVARVQHTDVLTLPRSAVVNDEIGPGVYVVERNGDSAVARRRPVVLGADAIGFVIVESGLSAGDEVVVLGQHSISDGDAVDVVPRPDGGTHSHDAHLPD